MSNYLITDKNVEKLIELGAYNPPRESEPEREFTRGPGDTELPRRDTILEEPGERQSRYRNVVFTLNNWTPEDWEKICSGTEFSYLVMGKEIGMSGTPHIQGYCEFTMQQRFNAVKRILGTRCWFQPRFGSPKQASDYCKEDGNYIERGRLSVPGAASVIADYRDQIVAGVHIDEITMEQPHIYHQYGRTLNRVQVLSNRGVKREWMTKGIWYHGPTGTGKSYTALKDYDVKTHYIWPNDGMWCDGYRGQEIVVINDYRGTMAELQYQDLLNMVDWTPYWVRRRGEEPTPFLAKTVIVTSSMSPTELWEGKVGGVDNIAQMLRRFSVVYLGVPFRHAVSESSGVILRPRDSGAWTEPAQIVDRQTAMFQSYQVEQARRLREVESIFRPVGRANVNLPMVVADLSSTHPAVCGLELPDA